MLRSFGFLGALFAGLAVLAGAFGSHALGPDVTAREKEIWSIASNYQLFHGLALILLALLNERVSSVSNMKLSGWFFTAGTFIFCGSLYAIVLTHNKKLGMVAPVGGLSLMVAWAILAIAFRNVKESPASHSEAS